MNNKEIAELIIREGYPRHIARNRYVKWIEKLLNRMDKALAGWGVPTYEDMIKEIYSEIDPSVLNPTDDEIREWAKKDKLDPEEVLRRMKSTGRPYLGVMMDLKWSDIVGEKRKAVEELRKKGKTKEADKYSHFVDYLDQ